MTSKLQAILGGVLTGGFGFIAWLIALPPELQTGVLGQVVAMCPPAAQPAVGFWCKTFATIAGIYATYKASHSGPQTPPKNPPQ